MGFFFWSFTVIFYFHLLLFTYLFVHSRWKTVRRIKYKRREIKIENGNLRLKGRSGKTSRECVGIYIIFISQKLHNGWFIYIKGTLCVCGFRLKFRQIIHRHILQNSLIVSLYKSACAKQIGPRTLRDIL